jgi:hypothetical protein
MKRVVALFLVCMFLASLASAQAPLRVPRISQGAKVTQIVGLSDITVAYHRPGVKGRDIWGNVVKYDEVWRAGTYRFLVLPAKSGDWTLIFNSEVKNWGTIYEAKYDTLKFAVKPEAGALEEWMSFSFTDLTPSSARMVLAWEKIRLSFVVEVNTLAKLQASVGSWQVLNQAARFALDNKVYASESMDWVNRSVAIEKNPRNLQTKAELLAQAGKTADAIATAEEAVKLAQAKDPKANVSGLEKLIQGWKGK